MGDMRGDLYPFFGRVNPFQLLGGNSGARFLIFALKTSARAASLFHLPCVHYTPRSDDLLGGHYRGHLLKFLRRLIKVELVQ
jgi:hypothetical protein